MSIRIKALVSAVAAAFALALAAPASADLSYTDFASTAGLQLNGAASTDGNVLRLTPAQGWLAGSAFATTPQRVQLGFTTTFRFRIAPSQEADGFAFVIQRDAMGPFALGGWGGYLGYGYNGSCCGGAGMYPAVAVEFDTWDNFGNAPGQWFGDPNDNHIAVHNIKTAGERITFDNRLGVASAVPTLDDGAVHTATVRYDGAMLDISLDGVAYLTVTPLDMAAALNAPADWDGTAFVGFTSGTGAAQANHDILSWTFTEAERPPVSTPGCKVTGGGHIVANNSDRATFGGNAKAPNDGQQEYQDHGPVTSITVHSLNVQVVACGADGRAATVLGQATINGSGPYDYRIDVKDAGEPGPSDTYRIRLSNGYDSGEQPVVSGNVQVQT